MGLAPLRTRKLVDVIRRLARTLYSIPCRCQLSELVDVFRELAIVTVDIVRRIDSNARGNE